MHACSYDDGSGSEAGDQEAHEGDAGAEADAPASEDGDSNMDAEVRDTHHTEVDCRCDGHIVKQSFARWHWVT